MDGRPAHALSVEADKTFAFLGQLAVYLCLCKGVTESDIRRLARSGIMTAPALVSVLGLREKRVCGRCVRDIARFVELAASEEVVTPQADSDSSAPPPRGW